MADLISDLEENAIIHRNNGNWSLALDDKAISNVLPDSILAMVERKLDQLSEENYQILTMAAIQGYEFNSAVVAELNAMDEVYTESRLHKLEHDFRLVQLIGEEEFPDGTFGMRYRFVHALYQNQLYNSQAPSHRIRLSRATADQLQKHHKNNLTVVANELANLYETAREYTQAASYYLVSAQQALQRVAPREAGLLSNKGFTLIPKLSQSALC